MFNQKKYYKYIQIMENIAIFKYIIVVAICILIGIIIGKGNEKIGDTVGLIIGAVGGIFIYYIIYVRDMIKIEEMKMRLDIYNKVSNKKENLLKEKENV